jgi:hypothetical protein
MHTDQTLDIFDETTTRIGAEFRAFNDKTCLAFETHELVREAEARKRRQTKKSPSIQGSTNPQVPVAPAATSQNLETNLPRRKKFSLRTYKYHSLGDYAKTVRRLDTTDSYTTEPVTSSASPMMVADAIYL